MIEMLISIAGALAAIAGIYWIGRWDGYHAKRRHDNHRANSILERR